VNEVLVGMAIAIGFVILGSAVGDTFGFPIFGAAIGSVLFVFYQAYKPRTP